MATTVYLPASFRDAEFVVETSSDEGGPRNVIHEFPGRRDAYAEPSGDYPDHFTVEAHLLGAGFEQRLLALEAALRQPGPGKLVHPHRGTKLVALDGPFRIQRSTRELGMVRLSLTFIEAGPAQEPRVAPDTTTDVKAKAMVAYTHIGAPKLSMKGPDLLTRAVRDILAGPKGIATLLSRVNNKLTAAFGLIDDVSHAIDEFSAETSALMNSPETLALHVRNLVNAILSAVVAANRDRPNRGDTMRDSARVLGVTSYLTEIGTFGDTLAVIAMPTTTRQRQADNQNALVDMVETAGLIESVLVLVDLPLDNTDQAGLLFAQIADIFDRILHRATLGDAGTQALRDLRAAFYAHLRRTTADLPELGRYTPPVTLPALVIAYQLYGDATRAAEIIERNPSIEHPGFVQGGVTLAVANV
jgi:prophage DNA circulation protein